MKERLAEAQRAAALIGDDGDGSTARNPLTKDVGFAVDVNRGAS
jgi:hypothetical protein